MLYFRRLTVDILLTFTGFHDPFVPSGVKGEECAGPILSVVGERAFDAVFLFQTPTLVEKTEATRDAILAKNKKIDVRILEVPLKDPTNYLGILRQLRKHFRKIQSEYPGANYFVSVSSGTPHMHASWLLLAASGEIPARILQSIPPQFVAEGKSRVKEIDFTQADFPRVSRSLEPVTDEGDEVALAEARRELGIVGEDALFLRALREAAVYAEYDGVHVLLLGETGSGKEYFAKLIHRLSSRSIRALVPVNCSALPENLVESQLFGHRKGAFTGATESYEGKFKAADGGILFLDEIGELPLATQAKLLRVLDSGEIEALGASKPSRVNVRVLAATNRDIRKMVQEGAFREDLYQRFSSTLRIPSLRQRRSDVARLAVYMLEKWNRQHKRERSFAPQALAALTQYDWPGNVRELNRVVTQSAMLSPAKAIRSEDLRFDEYLGSSAASQIPEPEEGFDLGDYLDNLKDKVIKRALEKTNGVQARAARLLGWSPQAMNQYLRQIDRKGKLTDQSANVDK